MVMVRNQNRHSTNYLSPKFCNYQYRLVSNPGYSRISSVDLQREMRFPMTVSRVSVLNQTTSDYATATRLK